MERRPTPWRRERDDDASECCDGDCERDAAGLVVDAVGRSGRGGRDDGAIRIRNLGSLLEAPGLLHGLEHPRRGLAHGHEIRMFLVEAVHRREYPKGHFEFGWVDGMV